MKQLVILSGKGGTGKTTIASAFIQLSKAKAYADCDVDAPNLHLIYSDNNLIDKEDYYGMPKSVIDKSSCINCGACKNSCNFNAIEEINEEIIINPLKCEGCGVCQLICPMDAIYSEEDKAGDILLYDNNGSKFSTSKLSIGNGTSGKLVTEVKKKLRNNAKDAHFAIIDGSPGIGCPVIASMNGADVVLIVTEPTLSGLEDLKRIVKTSRIFGVLVLVCINKFDINKDITNNIENYCNEENIKCVGKIPYDSDAVRITNLGKSIVEEDCRSGKALKEIFVKVYNYLHGVSNGN